MSYHLFVPDEPISHGAFHYAERLCSHVPTWIPPSSLYPPHRKFPHNAARSSGASPSSRHTTNSALSTTFKLFLLFLFDEISSSRRCDQIFLVSVVKMPRAFLATSLTGVLSASRTMASSVERISLSLSKGRFLESRQSNQSDTRGFSPAYEQGRPEDTHRIVLVG